MDQEELIRKAKIVARPYRIFCYILSLLLAISIAFNAIQVKNSSNLSIGQNQGSSDYNINYVGR